MLKQLLGMREDLRCRHSLLEVQERLPGLLPGRLWRWLDQFLLRDPRWEQLRLPGRNVRRRVVVGEQLAPVRWPHEVPDRLQRGLPQRLHTLRRNRLVRRASLQRLVRPRMLRMHRLRRGMPQQRLFEPGDVTQLVPVRELQPFQTLQRSGGLPPPPLPPTMARVGRLWFDRHRRSTNQVPHTGLPEHQGLREGRVPEQLLMDPTKVRF